METTSITNLPDVDFLAAVNGIKDRCAANMGQWGIPEAKVEELIALTEKAQLAFAANKDPSTKNASTQSAKNLAFKNLKAFIGPFIDALVLNLKVPDDALEAMGIRSRTREWHKRPIPEMVFYLFYDKIDTDIKLFGGRKKRNRPQKKFRPKEATGGMMIRWHYKGSTEINTFPSSKTTFLLKFPPEAKGQIIYVSGAWINSKYEMGPWCEWIEIVIG